MGFFNKLKNLVLGGESDGAHASTTASLVIADDSDPIPSSSKLPMESGTVYQALKKYSPRINRNEIVMIPNRINFFNCTVPARLIRMVDGDTFCFLVGINSKERKKFADSNPDEHFIFSERYDPNDIHYYMFKVRLLGYDAYESNTYFGLLSFIICISLFTKNYKIKLRTVGKFDNWSRVLSEVLFFDERIGKWRNYGLEFLGAQMGSHTLKEHALQASRFLGRNIVIKSVPRKNILLGIPYKGKGAKCDLVEVDKGLKERYNFIKRYTNYILCGYSSKANSAIIISKDITINSNITSADLVIIT